MLNHPVVLESFWKGPPPDRSASACHWVRREKIHLNLLGLCRSGDLRHDPMSRNTSEELLFNESLTIMDLMASPYIIGKL